MTDVDGYIREKVHGLYWDADENCARTVLRILSDLFAVPVEKQTLDAAVGLHGAGGYRAQCGLVEGSLMFIGIAAAETSLDSGIAVSLCRRFADIFEHRFGSLACAVLRPEGISPDNPPHLCENLTCRAVRFSYDFVKDNIMNLKQE